MSLRTHPQDFAPRQANTRRRHHRLPRNLHGRGRTGSGGEHQRKGRRAWL